MQGATGPEVALARGPLHRGPLGAAHLHGAGNVCAADPGLAGALPADGRPLEPGAPGRLAVHLAADVRGGRARGRPPARPGGHAAAHAPGQPQSGAL